MATPLLIPIMIECEGNVPLKDQIIVVPKADPQLPGIGSMVEAMPPVQLCGLFKVHLTHSNRAVTVSSLHFSE